VPRIIIIIIIIITFLYVYILCIYVYIILITIRLRRDLLIVPKISPLRIVTQLSSALYNASRIVCHLSYYLKVSFRRMCIVFIYFFDFISFCLWSDKVSDIYIHCVLASFASTRNNCNFKEILGLRVLRNFLQNALACISFKNILLVGYRLKHIILEHLIFPLFFHFNISIRLSKQKTMNKCFNWNLTIINILTLQLNK